MPFQKNHLSDEIIYIFKMFFYCVYIVVNEFLAGFILQSFQPATNYAYSVGPQYFKTLKFCLDRIR